MHLFRRGESWFFLASLWFLVGVFSLLDGPLLWWLRVVPDDIFYYLEVARRLADGQGSTFDGVTKTSGYHPAWMAILTAISPFVAGDEPFFRVALGLSFAVHFAGALAARWALENVVGRFGAWLGAAFWLLNPLSLRVSAQGMEGGIYALSLWLCVGVFAREIAGKSALSTRGALAFAAVLALAFYARTEAVVLAFVSIIFLLAREWQGEKRFAKTLRSRAWQVAGVFAILVFPWPLYCRLATGVWGQQSGAMKVLWASAEVPADGVERVLSEVAFFLLWWVGPFATLFAGLPATFFVLALPFFLALCFGFKKANLGRDFGELCVWLGAFWALTGAIYALFFADARTWYWSTPGVALLTIFWGLAARVAARNGALRERKSWIGAGVLVWAISLNVSFLRDVPAPYRWQSAAFEANAWLETRVPRGAKLGVWNAGVTAYFGGFRVVNLDGLMNNDVVPFWKNRDFGAYLKREKIVWLFDLPEAMERLKPFLREPLEVEEIAVHKPSRRVLWRVKTR